MVTPLLAHAQYPDDEPTTQDDGEVKEAVRLGRAALADFRAGAWQPALDGFAAADALAHSPLFTAYMARCHKELGHLLEARRLFQQIADEPLAEDAPEAFQRAKQQAAEGLDALTAVIPTLRVQVTGWRDGDRLTLDGEPLLERGGEAALEVDPGTHRVALWRDGAEVAFELVEAAEGTFALALEAPVTAAPPPSPEPTGIASPRVVLPPATPGSVPVAPIVTLGAGALGMIVGGITGALALSAAGEAEEGCRPGAAEGGGDLCPAANQAAHDRANLLATTSTVSLALGAAATVTGAVLMFTMDGDDAPEVELGVGPGTVTLSGRF